MTSRYSNRSVAALGWSGGSDGGGGGGLDGAQNNNVDRNVI